MSKQFTLTVEGTTYEVEVEGETVMVNGRPFTVTLDGNRAEVNGTSYEVELQGDQATVNGIAYALQIREEGERPGKGAPPRVVRAAAEEAGAVTAIMPGKIIRVLVKEGDQVQEGDVLCVLEAMKMENELRAGKSGVVKEVTIEPGSDVEMGEVLMVVA
ncbi:MAG TPA: biotin/lipoyl-binding protein [Anaerolineae bacterium]|nr:biotin/lipoyl-binding protein [Anaerolineae bacterium]